MHTAEPFLFESDDNDVKAWVRVSNTQSSKKCLKMSRTLLLTRIDNNDRDNVRCQDHLERKHD
jgi:hypothetical protein